MTDEQNKAALRSSPVQPEVRTAQVVNMNPLDYFIDGFENTFVCEVIDVKEHKTYISIQYKNAFMEGVVQFRNILDIHNACKQQREYHK